MTKKLIIVLSIFIFNAYAAEQKNQLYSPQKLVTFDSAIIQYLKFGTIIMVIGNGKKLYYYKGARYLYLFNPSNPEQYIYVNSDPSRLECYADLKCLNELFNLPNKLNKISRKYVKIDSKGNIKSIMDDNPPYCYQINLIREIADFVKGEAADLFSQIMANKLD